MADFVEATDRKMPRYVELAVPKMRFDYTSNTEAFKVKRGALSYRITESMKKLAEPRRYEKAGDANLLAKNIPPRNLISTLERRKASSKKADANSKCRQARLYRRIPTKHVSFVKEAI